MIGVTATPASCSSACAKADLLVERNRCRDAANVSDRYESAKRSAHSQKNSAENESAAPGGSGTRRDLCFRDLVAGGHCAGDEAEALVEAFFDQFLRFGLVDALDDRDFGDDQVLRTVIHLLLAEREALLFRDFVEVLEDFRHVFEAAGLHFLEIVAIAAFPVGMALLY